MNIQTLRQAVKTQLPSQVDTAGVPVARLTSACQANLADPSTPDPYGNARDTAQLNRDLTALAQGAQTDFGAQPLTIGQLATATGTVATQAAAQAEACAEEKSDLKHAYFKQVGFTTAWMAGLAGSLVVGGILPNPVSVIGIGLVATGTIRSINKARAAHSEMSAKLPALEQNMKASQQLAAAASGYAPLIAGWDSLLHT